MKRYLFGGALAAAMVGLAPALAQTPAPAPVAPQIQDRLGEPGGHGMGRDRIQTRATVAKHVQAMFARVDTNRDSVVTKAEVESVKAAHGGKRMMRHGGHGGPGGQHADRGAMFERLDANRDGAISRAEFDAAHAQRQQRMATRDKNGDGRPDARRMGGGHRMGMGGGLGGRMFDLADANRDSRVTLQEATNAALRHFDMADVNRDGQLTPDERRQMHQKMRGEHKPG